MLWAPRRTVALWGKSEKGLLRGNAPESCNEPTSKSAPPHSAYAHHSPGSICCPAVTHGNKIPQMDNDYPWGGLSSGQTKTKKLRCHLFTLRELKKEWNTTERKKTGGWGQESDKSEDIKPVVQGCPSTCCTKLGRVPHPQIHVHQQPQKVTLFGNRVLADVKLSYHHACLGWARIQWLGHLETHGCIGDSRDRVWKMQLQAKKYLGLLASTRS